MKQQTVHADKVQLAYAAILSKATTLSIVFVILGYVVYIFQLLPLSVPIEQVSENWHLRASEFHQNIHAPFGWNALSDFGKGDALSYISILYLGAVTMFCLVAAGFAFLKEKNVIYTAISFVQLLVLIFAATGILSGGH